MSEPRLISPMLDNYVMGDPISEHDGVRCCPAMGKENDDKYLVKIISVPASASQIDALLLSGAYSDKESVLSYFSGIASSIIDEVNVINQLAELDGFFPIDDHQVVPMEDDNGFDVYLRSAYRKTLQHQLRKGGITHLSAINLALDLCNALSTARRNGYLYINLKPGNIYLNDTQYRIGDIGFVKLDSLKYAALPDRYHSNYTAPEIEDAFSSLNDTLDVYAVGLILYQIYNDGMLPFSDDDGKKTAFPPPAYADYELSEIILKACSGDPEQRWSDPDALGQAIVEYMQRNGVNDIPITPSPTGDVTQEDASLEEQPKFAEKTDASEDVTEQSQSAVEETPEEVTDKDIYTEDAEGNLTFIESETDETMEAQDADEIDYEEVTEEVSEMLEQADELIAHDAPEPVVQPEAIDVPIPEPIELDDNNEAEAIDADESTAAITEDSNESDTECVETPENKEIVTESAEQDDGKDEIAELEDEPKSPKHKRKTGKWLVISISVLLLLALLAGGIYFYKNYYIQTVDAITLESGNIGELTVKVLSADEDAELSVICTDTYGIQRITDVVDGIALFTDLAPNSAYSIKVVTSGFHHLTGNITAAYTTPEVTEIVQFSAVTGSEDGSVILSFAINGPDSDQWRVSYLNDSGNEENAVFSGHMVTIPGLTVGNEYNFTLLPESKLQISGTTSITHVARTLIKPLNLHVTECYNGNISAVWSIDSNMEIAGWTARCYNDSYDQTITVTEPTAQFAITDDTASYTIEVTAVGMSVGERVLVSANSTTVKDFKVDQSTAGKLYIEWTPVNNIPSDGLILSYSVDGSAAKQIPCGNENRVSITPVVPDAVYQFVLQTSSADAVLGGTHSVATNKSEEFSDFKVTASDIEFKMCITPKYKYWDRYDLSKSDYTTNFSVGQKASFLLHLNASFRSSSKNVEALFVIRNESGNVISAESTTSTWKKMWSNKYCELDIPSIPQTAGNYTISVYFNSMLANKTNFTVN